MARPDKLTPEVAQRIVDAIRVGATVELAAAAAGVGIRTLYRWKKRGETSTSGKYWEFWERIKKAAAEEELGGVAEILLASRPKLIERETVTKPDGTTVTTEKSDRGDWHARAWVMERRHRQRWGRHISVDLDASTLGFAAVDPHEQRRARIDGLKRLTHEQRDQLRHFLKIARGEALAEGQDPGKTG